MIIAVHQPQYLPWLGYFHKIYSCDAFVYLDNVQYKAREYQNRNRIRIKEGCMWLSVPLIKDKNSYPNISAVRIDNSQDWPKRHWRAICLNYARSPFFAKYSGFFEDLYKQEWNRLVDLNISATNYILKSFQIDKPIYFESKLDIKTMNTQRIIDIARTLKADTYFSGVGAKAYLVEEDFGANGIKLIYQDFRHPEYNQRYGHFMPFMSAIDLLFNHGPDSLKILAGK